MRPLLSQEASELLKRISGDRTRTNLLKNAEQRAIFYLVQRIPAWVTPDMLTTLGLSGSLIILSGFVLAAFVNEYFLLLGILGFAINWFGDSLDGRLAYFRKRPRKWYGFSLDLIVDWITTILIGLGYVIYATNPWETVGYGFVVLYGWAMIIALLRYKITGDYRIDSGPLGPTEVRIVISLILLIEVFIRNTIWYCGIVACVALLVVNILMTLTLLHEADKKDLAEKQNKPQGIND